MKIFLLLLILGISLTGCERRNDDGSAKDLGRSFLTGGDTVSGQ